MRPTRDDGARRPRPTRSGRDGGLSGRRCAGAGIVAGIGVALLAAGCAMAGGASTDGPAGAAPQDDSALVPPGHGTLRQDEVTISLRQDELLIKATPLAESVIRLTAPDTYARLRELKREHRDALVRRSGVDAPALFLVSFFSYEPDVEFEPEDVHLENRGLRYRPLGIQPVTPGWGVQRLAQEETQMGVYAYDPGMDLEQDLAVEYREARRAGWDRILQRLQAERARAFARARSGS